LGISPSRRNVFGTAYHLFSENRTEGHNRPNADLIIIVAQRYHCYLISSLDYLVPLVNYLKRDVRPDDKNVYVGRRQNM
jgi:hypothetical protein